MANEIASRGTQALSEPAQNKSWGSEGIDQSDILIPKLLLMQPLSDAVGEGKAAPGDIIRSTSSEVLAKKGTALEIIPVSTFKTWVVSEFSGSRFEFRGVEPMTADNHDAPLEFMIDGKKWRRDRSLNFYVLLPADIARELKALTALKETGDLPDPDDALLPCVISFRRTSYGAGKDLATHFAKAAHFNVPPAVSTFHLGSIFEKNEQGQYYTFGVQKGRKTAPEELDAARRWYETLTKSKVVVDEESEAKVAAKVSGASAAKPVDTYDAEVAKTF